MDPDVRPWPAPPWRYIVPGPHDLPCDEGKHHTYTWQEWQAAYRLAAQMGVRPDPCAEVVANLAEMEQ